MCETILCERVRHRVEPGLELFKKRASSRVGQGIKGAAKCQELVATVNDECEQQGRGDYEEASLNMSPFCL